MKVLVDADACPVKELIISISKEYALEVLMFMDSSHLWENQEVKIIRVGQGRDAADFALINKTEKGDLVVTQDYGVATMALAKEAKAISFSGLIYDEKNIDFLLLERHVKAKIRRGGGRTNGPKKRTKEQDEKFGRSFRYLCEQALKEE